MIWAIGVDNLIYRWTNKGNGDMDWEEFALPDGVTADLIDCAADGTVLVHGNPTNQIYQWMNTYWKAHLPGIANQIIVTHKLIQLVYQPKKKRYRDISIPGTLEYVNAGTDRQIAIVMKQGNSYVAYRSIPRPTLKNLMPKFNPSLEDDGIEKVTHMEIKPHDEAYDKGKEKDEKKKSK